MSFVWTTIWGAAVCSKGSHSPGRLPIWSSRRLMGAAMNPERRVARSGTNSPRRWSFTKETRRPIGALLEDIRHLRQRVALAEGALRRGCHIRRAPGQVALKRLGSTAKEQQAATSTALENKAEVLSQVLPTRRELKFIGRTTCDRKIRQSPLEVGACDGIIFRSAHKYRFVR